MAIDFIEVLERFEYQLPQANITISRYRRAIENHWQPWVSSETDESVWTAGFGEVAKYLRELDRQDFAEGTRELRYISISKFYQELYMMCEEGQFSLPEPVEQRYQDAESIEEFDPTEDIDKSRFGIAGETTNKIHSGSGPSQTPYLTADEVSDLESATESLRNRLIIRMIYTTGLRRTEIAQLQLDDINRADQTINVPPVKGGERDVPYPDKTADLLREWLDFGGRKAEPGSQSSGYLFPSNRDEGHLTPNTIGRAVKSAGDRTQHQEVLAEYADGREIHKIGPHALRHSYGVRAIKSGIAVNELSDLMGHSNLETTNTYLQLAKKDVVEAGRAFDPDL